MVNAKEDKDGNLTECKERTNVWAWKHPHQADGTVTYTRLEGGVTFDGGKGTISGAFLGCLLMGVISNAMNILGVDNNVQTIITGAIIVAAVVLSNINNIKKK